MPSYLLFSLNVSWTDTRIGYVGFNEVKPINHAGAYGELPKGKLALTLNPNFTDHQHIILAKLGELLYLASLTLTFFSANNIRMFLFHISHK